MVLGFLFKKKKGKTVKKNKPVNKKNKKLKKVKRGRLNKKKSIKTVSKKEKNIEQIGKVTHYFPKVKAGVIKITKGPLRLGDVIYIKGHTTDFKQRISSMQIERKPIKIAKKGALIGLRVKQRVRQNDIVFKEFHPVRSNK
jgi:hypothetical protein